MSSTGWIGVDLDGTLAHYDEWKGERHIGAPVPAMLARVKRWLAEGREVRIFTARVSGDAQEEVDEARFAVQLWCEKHVGRILRVTCTKDFAMAELWDDRAVRVEKNSGQAVGPCPYCVCASCQAHWEREAALG